MAVSQEVSDLKAYHINQRDEGIDLHGVSGALMATTNMQMQTFVTGGPVVAFAQIKEMRCVISTMWPLHSERSLE